MKKSDFWNRPVKDSGRDVILVVTRRDVANANRKSAGGCAAANALCRQLGASEAEVHVSRSYVKRGKFIIRLMTPPDLREQVIAYDEKGTFDAGEFRLKAPSASKGLGGRKGSSKFTRRGKKRRSPIHVKDIRPEAPRGRAMIED